MSDVFSHISRPDLIAYWIEARFAHATRPLIVIAESERQVPSRRSGITVASKSLDDDDLVANIIKLATPVPIQRERHFVGLCAPSTFRDPTMPQRHFDGWTTHVVVRSGEQATRLKIPESPECSGPTQSNIWNQDIIHALRESLGISSCVADPNCDETRMHW